MLVRTGLSTTTRLNCEPASRNKLVAVSARRTVARRAMQQPRGFHDNDEPSGTPARDMSDVDFGTLQYQRNVHPNDNAPRTAQEMEHGPRPSAPSGAPAEALEPVMRGSRGRAQAREGAGLGPSKPPRVPALETTLDVAEADVGVGVHMHHVVPPLPHGLAGRQAKQFIRRLEESAPTNIDEARGMPTEQLGAGGHVGDASRGPMAAEHDASPPTGELTAQPHGSTRGQAQERAGEPYDAGRAAARAYGPGHEREIGGTWTDADSGLHGRPLADLGSEARVREAERLISGSSTNKGAALSHPEEHQQQEGGR